MPKCEFCKGEMKPLFQSWYCPKDCDRLSQPSPNDFNARLEAIWANIDRVIDLIGVAPKGGFKINFAGLNKTTSPYKVKIVNWTAQ